MLFMLFIRCSIVRFGTVEFRFLRDNLHYSHQGLMKS